MTVDLAGTARMVLAYAAGVDVGHVQDGMSLVALGIDSLSAMGSIAVLNAELGVDLQPEQAGKLFAADKVSDFISLLQVYCSN